MGRSAGNVGEQIGMGRSAGSVGEQIGKRPICSQFRLKNRPADSLQFMLAFRPHSDLLAGASTVSARPVCASAGLLARRVNRPASKPVRTDALQRIPKSELDFCLAYLDWQTTEKPLTENKTTRRDSLLISEWDSTGEKIPLRVEEVLW